MSKLYVTEYPTPSSTGIPSEPALVDQTPVTFTTTTQSAAFGPNTTMVRIHTDGICCINFGTNPTATVSNRRLNANQTDYYMVPQGQSYKVAAVTTT